ncbi:MAG: hypothetical protein KY476_18460 [Planctomycetes bacterium]|nr:hypothetical protein [Planctomycetota bacterium]
MRLSPLSRLDVSGGLHYPRLTRWRRGLHAIAAAAAEGSSRLREAAGLPPVGRPLVYDDCEVISVLQELFRKSGPQLTQAMLRERMGISPGTIHQRFGGWSKLCELAGVTVRPPGKRPYYSRESILQALQSLQKSGCNRICKADFSSVTGISSQAIVRHWGSWIALREAAGMSLCHSYLHKVANPLASAGWNCSTPHGGAAS